jgi:signal transduction histidine kinase
MTTAGARLRRRIWLTVRGRGGPEARLVLLGLIGGGVCVSLVATLVFVQHSLERSQRQLAELAVPAEERIAQIEASLDAAFRRQGRIAATITSSDLEGLRDRRSVEEHLREAARASAITTAGGAAAPDLPAHVEQFLIADAAFFEAFARKHALDTECKKRLSSVADGVHGLVEATRSLSGLLRLDYMVQLRVIASSLDRGAARGDLMRSITLGPGRRTREATLQLVEALLELGWRVDSIGETTPDQLASVTANVLPQARERIERLIDLLQTNLAADPGLHGRAAAIGSQFHELLPRIADDTNRDSLVSLRRRVLEEGALEAAIRRDSEAAAQQLTSDSEQLRQAVAAFIGRSIHEASLTRTTTREFSVLLTIAGLLGCLFAARRISQGIDELTSKNRTLTGLKENLTALNASLDARVAERTQALSAANERLKHEIVEREKVELELRLAQKLESLGRLASGVAHEINTPVQYVSDSIYFMRDSIRDLGALFGKYRQLEDAVAAGTASPEEARALAEQRNLADLDYALENLPSALERALEGLQRISTIVKSMKTFAHPDQKEMTKVDLNSAIETTLIIAASEYKLVADVDKSLEQIPQVSCYAGEINQVLLNLIVNSAHAIGDVVRGTSQKGRIHIASAQEGNMVVISIGDTGGGIPVAIRDRIFDPFFTTKEVGKGTGQGLAIARSVIQEKHGGSLTFESELGKGTTFKIRLAIDGKSESQPWILDDEAPDGIASMAGPR